MTVTRRKMLFLAGGGAILAASGAFAFAATRKPQSAHLAWEQAGSYEDPRRRALSWALLAPSPHNRQPWLADLSEPGVVTLHADVERLLPHTDPYNRQITIGLGCFLELLRMAAAEDGYRADTTVFPQGSDVAGLDQRPVARIVLRRIPQWSRSLCSRTFLIGAPTRSRSTRTAMSIRPCLRGWVPWCAVQGLAEPWTRQKSDNGGS